MKILIKEVATTLKSVLKTNVDRLKLLLLFIAIITLIGSGIYGIFYSLGESGIMICLNLISCIGLWFGIGLIDMVRDMFKH